MVCVCARVMPETFNGSVVATTKQNLLDLEPDALRGFFTARGEQAYRAAQVMRWIFHRGVLEFEHMTDLSRTLRESLHPSAEVRTPEMVNEQLSADGTRKWVLRLVDGNCIEMVYIPEPERGTLCISSQVGCALDCSFCATARQGFNRNLTVAEIIGQVWLAHELLDDHQAGSGRMVSNIVFMGMGEPLLNFNNVVSTLRVLVDDLGYGLSKRRVTVSTAGVVPAIDRLREAIDVSLAVSLHAPNDTLRDELVPLNRKYPLAELMPACKRYVQGERKKLITFEYVMLRDVNDSPAYASELLRLLEGIPAKVNLIPFNPFAGCGYQTSTQSVIERFRDILYRAGVMTITRKTRGDDIDAACGQLAGRVEDRSRRFRRFSTPRFGESLS